MQYSRAFFPNLIEKRKRLKAGNGFKTKSKLSWGGDTSTFWCLELTQAVKEAMWASSMSKWMGDQGLKGASGMKTFQERYNMPLMELGKNMAEADPNETQSRHKLLFVSEEPNFPVFIC